ncbi:MAG: hypothetical protein IJT87_10695, partial [Ruminiclostridium sp.]|nr:hypothetical protein [Ruminiclostridium sp.]
VATYFLSEATEKYGVSYRAAKERVSLGRQRSLGYLGAYGVYLFKGQGLCKMQCLVQQTL